MTSPVDIRKIFIKSETDSNKQYEMYYMIWKNENTKTTWKKENLNLLVYRMSGWQLETFKESYSNKIKTGFSLYKENLLKNKDEK